MWKTAVIGLVAAGHGVMAQDPPECVYTKDHQPRNSPSILMPVYVGYNIKWDNITGECLDPFFLEVAKGCRAVTAIINPYNGPWPDDHKNLPGLKACTKLLAKNKVATIGYVSTKRASVNIKTGEWTTKGLRNITEIYADVRRWQKQFSDISFFRGFFLDEITSTVDTLNRRWGVDHISFYRSIVRYSRRVMTKALVVLNSGAIAPLELLTAAKGYPNPANYSVSFESFASHWQPGEGEKCRTTSSGSYGPGPWCQYANNVEYVNEFVNAVKSGQAKVGGMVHSANWDFAWRQVDVAVENKLRYFFVTDRTLKEDPWISEPSFWTSYLDYLNKREDGIKRPSMNVTITKESTSSTSKTSTVSTKTTTTARTNRRFTRR